MAGPTYVKGYLRAYSKKLDLDPEVVLQAYERYLKDKRSKEKSKKKANKQFDPIRLPIILITIIVIVVFLILFILLLRNGDEANINKESSNSLHSDVKELNQESLETKAMKDPLTKERIEIKNFI